mmetsp:Transcript_4014/g.6087  ORF Transcript_4014/g.6087 Transcript_4014/m.6087 type:complete len:208 (+) Transcript_4014:201-824(+)
MFVSSLGSHHIQRQADHNTNSKCTKYVKRQIGRMNLLSREGGNLYVSTEHCQIINLQADQSYFSSKHVNNAHLERTNQARARVHNLRMYNTTLQHCTAPLWLASPTPGGTFRRAIPSRETTAGIHGIVAHSFHTSSSLLRGGTTARLFLLEGYLSGANGCFFICCCCFFVVSGFLDHLLSEGFSVELFLSIQPSLLSPFIQCCYFCW